MENTINWHNFDEKQELTLNDLQENGKEKITGLSDDELKKLKQQALEAEDYDICKLIKQEQTERAERAKETWEDMKEEDDLQELEEQTRREEEWHESKEKDLQKADELKGLLNESDDVIAKNFPWLTSENENNWDPNEKDEFMENLWKNQEWYATLSEGEKKQFRILYDISKIFDNNQKNIDEYQKNLSDRDWMSRIWDYTGDERKRKDDALEREAKSIVSDLDKEFSKYSRIYSWVENARVQNLFKLMKYTSNKWLFMEKSYMEVLHEMVDVLKDIKKYLETEKSFKLAVINIRDIRVPE